MFPSRFGGVAAAANGLRRALGVLWLADGLVKLSLPFGDRPGEQAYEQIMTAESGPPGFHRLLATEAHAFIDHPLVWWLPAAVELGIGVWLITQPSSRRAVAASGAWAAIVWLVAEGAGGLLSGVASVLTGYPGAALLYAVVSVVLFPGARPREEAAAAAEAGAAGQWSRVLWLALWIGAAFFTALPQTGSNGLEFMLTVNQADGAGPLRALDSRVLGWLTIGTMTRLGFAVAALCVVIGFTVFLGVWPRVFLSLAIGLALAAWVVFQNFGGIYTGAATDVGTGPVLILLALAYWPLRGGRGQQARKAHPAAAAAPVPSDPGGAQGPAAGEEPSAVG